MDGYMIDVQCDDESLRVQAKTKAARGALTGWEPQLVTNDDGKLRVKTNPGESSIEIPRAAIADVTFKGASMMANGNLIVTTVDGAKYQLHFRKKQQDDFRALAQELGVVLA